MYKLEVFAVFVLCGLSLSAALKCYTCSSDKQHASYRENCHDEDLKVSSLLNVDCKPEENICMKVVSKTTKVVKGVPEQSHTITSRLCGTQKRKNGNSMVNIEDECENREANAGYTSLCQCTSDNCNSGDFVKASIFSIAVASVLSLLVSRVF